MALNLSTLTSSATSGDVLAEMLTTADFLEPVPLLKNLARGSNKGGNAKQGTALNQPKALPLIDGKGYLYLSGGWNTNNASIPHDSSVDILGNLTVIVKATMPVWGDPAGHQVFAAKRQAGEANGWQLHVHTGTKSLRFYRGTSASSSHSSSASIDIPFSDNSTGYLKVENTPDNGSSQSTTIFYTSTDGVTWSQLGSTITKTNFTPYSNASGILIASDANGSSMVGGLHKLQLFASTDGSNKVLDVDFTASNVRHNDTKFKCATGQTVTINQSGNDPATIIKKSVLRFDGVNDGLQGLFGQTITDGYMFAAFSVLGSGGDASGRVFSVHRTGGYDDYGPTGLLFSAQAGTSGGIMTYNNATLLTHDNLFDDANGDVLHQVKALAGNLSSKINNADLKTSSNTIPDVDSDNFNIGSQRFSNGDNAAIDLEYLALFPASITDSQADRVRNYINNRNTVFDLKDGFGHYFYDPQDAPVGAISSGSSSWNGRIVGSDNGDVDKYATQTTSTDQPVSDGIKVTFADNTDHLDIPSTAQAGWQICGTSLGTFSYRVRNEAQTELSLLGYVGNASYRKVGDLYGVLLLPESATGKDIKDAKKLLIDRGASDAGAAGSYYTNWFQRDDIVEFGNIDLSAATSVEYAWNSATHLETFSPTDISNCTNFRFAWQNTPALTSFPSGAKLGTAATNVNFTSAWFLSGLTSFPALDLSNGTLFNSAWQNTALTSFPAGAKLGTAATNVNFTSAWDSSNLTSFPALDLSNGNNFVLAFYACSNLTSLEAGVLFSANANNIAFYAAFLNCTSLVDFPSGAFDGFGTPANDCFLNSWLGCSALSADSVENILVSINTSGQSAPSTGPRLTIDYNVATGSLSAATNAAITSLIGKGWQVYINNVLTIPNVLALAPAAAYSLRSFDSDLDPNVVNVRRSSDNATSDFKASEVSDGTLVAFVGAGNDGHVTTWYDQGGTNHSNQATASNQPKIVAGGSLVITESLPAVQFDGNDQLGITDTFNSAFSAFAVATNTGTLDRSDILRGISGDYLFGSCSDPEIYRSRADSVNIEYATQDNDQHLHSSASNGSTNSAAIDGGTFISVSDSNINETQIFVGGYLPIGGGTFNWKGTIQEVVIFKSDESANRTGIDNNINDTYTIY